MNTHQDQENKFFLSIADILSLFRQSKKKILYGALLLGLIGILWALITPIHYQAEGTFREKNMKSNQSLSSSVLQVISGAALVEENSEATSLMTSRKILKEVIEKLNLQANLEAIADRETIPKTIKNNLKLVAAEFSLSPQPVLPDLCCPLTIKTMQYTGELPLKLRIDLKQDQHFEVFDILNSKQLLGKGKLGKPFEFKELSITLVPTDSTQPISSLSFILNVNSLTKTVNVLSKILKVETSKLDKGLLTFKCKHRQRQLASEIINVLMGSYQAYLKKYQQEMAFNQLDYLSLRQDQLTQNLTDLMKNHADLLAEDLSHSGFIESDKEMDFLAKSQYEYKQKLLDNELEIKRLTHIKPNNLAYYDRHSNNEGAPEVINSILSEMRSLKQERDSLEIELQKKPLHQEVNLQQSFEQHLNELKEVQEYLKELKDISDQYEKGNAPNPDSKLLNDSRFLLKGWFERLQNMQKDHATHWKETHENFQFYLTNLQRLFGVHERILQERLTHQQNPSGEYQGISLELATSLYLEYSKNLVQMEGTIRQNLFFINQIEDPNFELTSLSSGLTDPVSSMMIHKASILVLNLRDQNNQSVREQERIKDELNLQRTFLTLHLKQMVQLMELNKQLMDEKIFALQNVSLELIHQRISLLEKNLQDYLTSRLNNLHQERLLIKRHLESIHSDMALLPRKWVSEQILQQAVITNQRIVEEITKLVESKNISHNLEIIRSAPIDLSIPPVYPELPRVFLLGFLGFMLGGSLGSCFVLVKGLSQGLKVSAENLELMGYHYSGELITPLSSQPLQGKNFNTLRRLQTYFDTSVRIGTHSSVSREAEILLLIEGQGPDYATDLADLFLKRGCRVLTIDLNFAKEKEKNVLGLLDYLQGAISTPPIQKGGHGDEMAAGGMNHFAIEMLGSPLFNKLIEQLKPHYDWILAVSHALPTSMEAESLLTLFPYAAITLTQEKTNEIDMYHRFLEQVPPHKLSFILYK